MIKHLCRVLLLFLILINNNCSGMKALNFKNSNLRFGIFGNGSKLFGYYGSNNIGDPDFDDVSRHTNYSPQVQDVQDAEVLQIEALGRKYNFILWGDLHTGAEWDAWIARTRPHIPYIAAFYVAEEPACDPATANALEAKIQKLKSVFPNTPTMITYVANGSFTAGLRLNPKICFIPPSLDWLALELYGRARNATDELTNVVRDMHEFLLPHQKMLLIPQAYVDVGYEMTEQEMVDRAEQAYEALATDSSVVGIAPYTYGVLRTYPNLKAKYAEIGRRIVGDNAPLPNPPPPTGTPAVPPAGTEACPLDANGVDGLGVCSPWQFVRCDGYSYYRVRTCAANSSCRTSDWNGPGTPLNWYSGPTLWCGLNGQNP
jgi:hypothetical protein